MVCEELFNLFDTSSEEITEKAKNEATKEAMEKADAYYHPKIDELSSANNTIFSKIDYLQNRLIRHNIPFSYKA